jgi:hypothetical protein
VKEGTFEGKPSLKVDRLFGRLKDGELMKMFKAQKGEQFQRLRELQNEKREKHRELYTTTLSPRRQIFGTLSEELLDEIQGAAGRQTVEFPIAPFAT